MLTESKFGIPKFGIRVQGQGEGFVVVR